jgi:hypothetical protein
MVEVEVVQELIRLDITLHMLAIILHLEAAAAV